jgi:hypothetical protein
MGVDKEAGTERERAGTGAAPSGTELTNRVQPALIYRERGFASREQ